MKPAQDLPASYPAGSSPPAPRQPAPGPPQSLLSKEEVEALVGGDGEAPPGSRALWAAGGMVLALLAVAAVALWAPGGDPYQEVRRPAPPELAQAREALQEGSFARALDLLGQAAASPLAPPAGRLDRLRAQALLGRAARVLETDQALAAADVASALTLAPLWPQAQLGAGKVSLRLGRVEEAFLAFDRAAGLDPGNDVAWYNRGYALLKLERYAEAAESFRRVVALDSPFAADAHVNLAVSLAQLGRRQEAVQSLEKALAINPNNQLAREHLASLRGQGEGRP
jgi:tetratricopeptide (TPR) repeat protein